MVEPISPKEVVIHKEQILPEYVIEAWNEIIAEKFNGSSAHINQKDVVIRIISKSKNTISINDVYAKNYLDIEDIYRAKGWFVKYDKPAYYENYEPSFTFRSK